MYKMFAKNIVNRVIIKRRAQLNTFVRDSSKKTKKESLITLSQTLKIEIKDF